MMSDNPAPLVFRWDGDAMVPQRPKLADREYVVGEIYRLGIIEERSANTHNHFFAALAEAWNNLPDHLAERHPTVEHLRKAALIATGWCDTHSLVCASKAEAARVAAFMRPVDEFSLVTSKEATVTRYTAKSQSNRAMGAKDFQRSKQGVLDWVSALIGTSPAQLAQNVGKAA